MPDRRARLESRRWLERLGLADCEKRRVEALSKGMAQKVQFIASLLHQPELLILDEPFSGLDPVNMEVIREAILELRRLGATILFSTHDMEVAERMCDFILMIHRGRKVLDGTLDSIQQRYAIDTVRIRISGGTVAFEQLPGVTRVNDFGGCRSCASRRDVTPSRSWAPWSAGAGRALRGRPPAPARHLRAHRRAGAVRPEDEEGAAMRITWVIAWREYRASVRTKAFSSALVLMPILMFGALAIPKLMRGRVDVETSGCWWPTPRPAGAAAAAGGRAAQPARGEGPQNRRQVEPRFVLNAAPTPTLDDQQRYELSQRIRKGELHAFAEIDASVLEPAPLPGSAPP